MASGSDAYKKINKARKAGKGNPSNASGRRPKLDTSPTTGVPF